MEANGGPPRDPVQQIVESETLRRANESLKRTRRLTEETRRILDDARDDEDRAAKE